MQALASSDGIINCQGTHAFGDLTSNLTSLPAELRDLIFKHLGSFEEQGVALGVSRKFRQMGVEAIKRQHINIFKGFIDAIALSVNDNNLKLALGKVNTCFESFISLQNSISAIQFLTFESYDYVFTIIKDLGYENLRSISCTVPFGFKRIFEDVKTYDRVLKAQMQGDLVIRDSMLSNIFSDTALNSSKVNEIVSLIADPLVKVRILSKRIEIFLEYDDLSQAIDLLLYYPHGPDYDQSANKILSYCLTNNKLEAAFLVIKLMREPSCIRVGLHKLTDISLSHNRIRVSLVCLSLLEKDFPDNLFSGFFHQILAEKIITDKIPEIDLLLKLICKTNKLGRRSGLLNRFFNTCIEKDDCNNAIKALNEMYTPDDICRSRFILIKKYFSQSDTINCIGQLKQIEVQFPEFASEELDSLYASLTQSHLLTNLSSALELAKKISSKTLREAMHEKIFQKCMAKEEYDIALEANGGRNTATNTDILELIVKSYKCQGNLSAALSHLNSLEGGSSKISATINIVRLLIEKVGINNAYMELSDLPFINNQVRSAFISECFEVEDYLLALEVIKNMTDLTAKQELFNRCLLLTYKKEKLNAALSNSIRIPECQILALHYLRSELNEKKLHDDAKKVEAYISSLSH